MGDYMAKSILITQRAVSDGSAVSLSPVPQALSALNKHPELSLLILKRLSKRTLLRELWMSQALRLINTSCVSFKAVWRLSSLNFRRWYEYTNLKYLKTIA